MIKEKPYRLKYPNAFQVRRQNKSVTFGKQKDGYFIEIRDMTPDEISAQQVKRHGMRIIQIALKSETLTDLLECIDELLISKYDKTHLSESRNGECT